MTEQDAGQDGTPPIDPPSTLGLVLLAALTAGLIVLAVLVPSIFAFLAAIVAAAALVTQGVRYQAARP